MADETRHSTNTWFGTDFLALYTERTKVERREAEEAQRKYEQMVEKTKREAKSLDKRA